MVKLILAVGLLVAAAQAVVGCRPDVAADVFVGVNLARAESGQVALALDDELVRIAAVRAAEVAGGRGAVVQQNIADGHQGFMRFALGHGWPYRGEILCGTPEVSTLGNRPADSCMAGFRQSPEHRNIMISPWWSKMGVAAVLGSDGWTYVAVEFEV